MSNAQVNKEQKMNSATVTGLETATTNGVARRPPITGTQPPPTEIPGANGDAARELRKASNLQKKYRHTVAVHSQSRPSCLSHDAPETPSFLGFRNLMVIVLGEDITSSEPEVSVWLHIED